MTKKAQIISILVLVLLYAFSISTFFSGDDWFHLRISQINSLTEFTNFFSFVPTDQSAAFYRPLSTQVFFFILQKMFGLTVWPYHVFVLLCFSYSLYLVNQFAQREFKDSTKAWLTMIIYGLSVSNFTRIYFLSAFQEIALVIFSLLCLLSFPKSIFKSVCFFVLALLSKETAVVLPFLILIFNYKNIKRSSFRLLVFLIPLLVYLYPRLNLFGMVAGDSYHWVFSVGKTLNTIFWYILWSFGAPELLIDYIGSGFRPIARLFTDYPGWWQVILFLLFGTLSSSFLLFLTKIKELNFSLLKYTLFFILSLSPFIFLPAHKFALELGLPLVGFALSVAWLLPKKKSYLSVVFLLFYTILNLSMNYLTYVRHYSVSRGEISQRVYSYLVQKHPTYPSNSYFEFINDTTDNGKEWGQSKQVSQSLSGSDMFKVFYKDKSIKVFYEDFEDDRPDKLVPVRLSTEYFLNK
jgi:hypothetical protein